MCVWGGGACVCVCYARECSPYTPSEIVEALEMVEMMDVLCMRWQTLHPSRNGGNSSNCFFLEASFQHLGVINKTKDECWAVANDYVQTFLVKY